MKHKNLIIYTLLIIIIVLVVILGIKLIKKDSQQLVNNCDVKTDYKATGHAENVQEYNGEVPHFTVVLKGSIDDAITNDGIKLNDVQLYEFDATMITSWETKRDHYIGIKLNDILQYKGIKDFESLTFVGYGNMQITYEKNNIDLNETYFVLRRNGNKIYDLEVSLLSIGYYYNMSLEGLKTMTVNK